MTKEKFFQEKFDLDMEENVSKIEVPDFRDGRAGRFLHDFQNNETAIIDQGSRRCFVMPLDRDSILPPQSMADLIRKMYQGYYDIDTSTVRKQMRVVTPALDDLSMISPKIESACQSMNVYRLEKYVSGGKDNRKKKFNWIHWLILIDYFVYVSVVKRSAELTTDGKFAEFSGRMIEYDLVNIAQVNTHERK